MMQAAVNFADEKETEAAIFLALSQERASFSLIPTQGSYKTVMHTYIFITFHESISLSDDSGMWTFIIVIYINIYHSNYYEGMTSNECIHYV
jgi:hypothetical protein